MISRRNASSHSLASLVIAPDDHEYLRKVRNILEEQPRTGPPEDPTELCPYLFMGSLKNANNLPLLRKLGITHILNCAGNFRLMRSPYSHDPNIAGYLTITAEDHAEYDIMRHFDETFAFLDNCKRSGGKALVHCNLGINRSGAICAAYLMVDQHLPLLQVISLLKRKRNLVLCNKGFRRQLIRFARTSGYLENQTTAIKRDYSFGLDRTNTMTSMRSLSASYKDHEHADHDNGVAVVRSIRPYGRSKSANITGAENYQSEHNSNTLHVPAMSTHSSGRPNRFASDYHSLPRTTSRVGDNPGRKRPLNASHYDKEYFMDTIPEDGRCVNGDRDISKSDKLPKKETSRNLSSFGNRAFINFRKSKSKSTDCLNGSPAVKVNNDSVLSSTRPLRVYKRSVTDTELYEKPAAAHQYKRADTVATTDITAGLERLSMEEQCGESLSRQQRSISKLSLSSNIFSRLKPEMWKRSSRTSLSINS